MTGLSTDLALQEHGMQKKHVVITFPLIASYLKINPKPSDIIQVRSSTISDAQQDSLHPTNFICSLPEP